MKCMPTRLPGVLILEPTVFNDPRGFFMESWSARSFNDATGLDVHFVQDNHSQSAFNVLRGIHYQVVKPQGKLVRVVTGTVFDVAVDLRRSSENFGRWVGVELSARNKRQLWIPPGFGHAFLVRSPMADSLYKTTEYWIPEYDRAIAWNDADIGIDWALTTAPMLAARDLDAPRFREAELFD